MNALLSPVLGIHIAPSVRQTDIGEDLYPLQTDVEGEYLSPEPAGWTFFMKMRTMALTGGSEH